MQRFAGLNSIEGWNLTLQLSSLKNNDKNVDVLEYKTYNGNARIGMQWDKAEIK